MNFNSFCSDTLATMIGGIFLTLLFFWLREKIFPLPKVTGRWHFEICTVHTAYKPYENMVLRYVAMLWREGNRIEGTVEKIYENSSTGERDFVGKNRTRGEATGYIEKNYFAKDRIFLHIVENGHGRESTNFYELILDSNEEMSGTFSSMVANQDGSAKWRRKEF
ncbi:hypothetical protein [Geomonas oryzae]|uniref:hypothetical protein n=1 Tax=Geomonas oryzae TaxID=2364273 RepID=UPI00100A449C|nr:hypothetical protein [Geomonas oryzae]